ncbi:MAG: PQQ-binding-like beta-propeller repeat protein [Cruoricaptor ignavus]|nr:PQQ-binding-like beta-propeller repeat protein [Cruoricaptor ignavus]
MKFSKSIFIKCSVFATILLIWQSCNRMDEGHFPELPIASFEVINSRTAIGDTVQVLQNSVSIKGNIAEWHWDFGNGDTSDKKYPAYSYSEEGNYELSLYVVDNLGNKSENVFKERITVITNVDKEPQILWQTELPYFAELNSMSISTNGLIHIGTMGRQSNPERGNNALAVRNGSIVWGHLMRDAVRSTPTVTESGVAYYASITGEILAVEANGNVKWNVTLPHRIYYTSPVYAKDGTIYIGSEQGLVYALNPENGSTKWTFNAGTTTIRSTPVIDSKGFIYIASNDDYLYKISPEGQEVWRSFVADYIRNGIPAIDETRNTIYVSAKTAGTQVGVLVAYNLDSGAEQWRNDSRFDGRLEDGGPAIAEDGTLYLGGRDKKLVAYNTDGTVKWEYETTGLLHGVPAIDDRGQIYFGDDKGYFYIVDRNGKTAWKNIQLGTKINTSVNIDDNGIVYVLSQSGNTSTITAMKTNATSYAKNSPWAMQLKNPQRSGSNMR